MWTNNWAIAYWLGSANRQPSRVIVDTSALVFLELHLNDCACVLVLFTGWEESDFYHIAGACTFHALEQEQHVIRKGESSTFVAIPLQVVCVCVKSMCAPTFFASIQACACFAVFGIGGVSVCMRARVLVCVYVCVCVCVCVTCRAISWW